MYAYIYVYVYIYEFMSMYIYVPRHMVSASAPASANRCESVSVFSAMRASCMFKSRANWSSANSLSSRVCVQARFAGENVFSS